MKCPGKRVAILTAFCISVFSIIFGKPSTADESCLSQAYAFEGAKRSDEAMAKFEDCAFRGDPKAQHQLGRYLFKLRLDVRALAWYMVAKENGYKTADYGIRNLKSQLSSTDQREAFLLSDEYLAKIRTNEKRKHLNVGVKNKARKQQNIGEDHALGISKKLSKTVIVIPIEQLDNGTIETVGVELWNARKRLWSRFKKIDVKISHNLLELEWEDPKYRWSVIRLKIEIRKYVNYSENRDNDRAIIVSSNYVDAVLFPSRQAAVTFSKLDHIPSGMYFLFHTENRVLRDREVSLSFKGRCEIHYPEERAGNLYHYLAPSALESGRSTECTGTTIRVIRTDQGTKLWPENFAKAKTDPRVGSVLFSEERTNLQKSEVAVKLKAKTRSSSTPESLGEFSFVLKDVHGSSISNLGVRIETDRGHIVAGRTDDNGELSVSLDRIRGAKKFAVSAVDLKMDKWFSRKVKSQVIPKNGEKIDVILEYRAYKIGVEFRDGKRKLRLRGLKATIIGENGEDLSADSLSVAPPKSKDFKWWISFKGFPTDFLVISPSIDQRFFKINPEFPSSFLLKDVARLSRLNKPIVIRLESLVDQKRFSANVFVRDDGKKDPRHDLDVRLLYTSPSGKKVSSMMKWNRKKGKSHYRSKIINYKKKKPVYIQLEKNSYLWGKTVEADQSSGMVDIEAYFNKPILFLALDSSSKFRIKKTTYKGWRYFSQNIVTFASDLHQERNRSLWNRVFITSINPKSGFKYLRSDRKGTRVEWRQEDEEALVEKVLKSSDKKVKAENFSKVVDEVISLTKRYSYQLGDTKAWLVYVSEEPPDAITEEDLDRLDELLEDAGINAVWMIYSNTAPEEKERIQAYGNLAVFRTGIRSSYGNGRYLNDLDELKKLIMKRLERNQTVPSGVQEDAAENED